MKPQIIAETFLSRYTEACGGFVASENSDLHDIEITLPAGIQFPNVLKVLYGHHVFDSFEVGPIEFLSNRDGRLSEFNQYFETNEKFIRACCAHQFLPFARCMTGSYDPVCFDLAVTRQSKRDFPVVIVDHESILLNRKKIKVRPVAKGLLSFMKDQSFS